MTYPDELLELAQEIANLRPDSPHQASLRRAVSTAYYGFFHLLILEATENWGRPEFGYFRGKPAEGPERTVAFHLYNVADTFSQAQYHRTETDYNLARQWERTEVLLHIEGIADAFKSWKIVRDDPASQAFLVSMLLSKERRLAD